MLVVRQAVKKLGMAPWNTRVVVQGFGNVGSYAALLLDEQGFKVVGIAEWNCGLHNAKGINIKQLFEYKAANSTIQGFPGAEPADQNELMVSDCDVLVPAAIENVITTHNAANIKAKIIAEGANGPTTAAADDILQEKGVFIIPDILANAGGVTASYFEWVQDRQGYFWKEAHVNSELEHIMTTAFHDVLRYAESHEVNNRIAAYMLAIDRVASTIRTRGIYA